MRKAGLSAPKFELTSFFTVVFRRPSAEKNPPETREKTVEKTVEKILCLIRENPKITQKKLSELTGLTRRGIEWNIEQLKKTNRLKRIGSDRIGYWEVVRD